MGKIIFPQCLFTYKDVPDLAQYCALKEKPCYMNTTYPFPIKLYPVRDNFISLNTFLKDSYCIKKDAHEQRISFLKGVFEANDKMGCHSNTNLPVNNFLKNFSQIEEDFKKEHMNAGGYCIYMEGKVLTDEEVLSRQMEENY